jgi:hypothetical protein
MSVHKYEVHYINDNFVKRVLTFCSRKEANAYIDMLSENAIYLYRIRRDGSLKLLYTYETSQMQRMEITMNKNSITKEQLWKIIGKYINHVGDCEGIDFLSDHHIPSKWIDMEERLLLQSASNDSRNE